MARRIASFTASAGRDAGKVFRITEMPADQAERWAIKAFLAAAKGGVKLPEAAAEPEASAESGFAGIAQMGFSMLANMPPELAFELLDEMMACVQYQPNPAKPEVVRGLVSDDIEEVVTRLQLRKAVFDLHVDFSQAAAQSTSASAQAASASQEG
jgi:hypothetical protein